MLNNCDIINIGQNDWFLQLQGKKECNIFGDSCSQLIARHDLCLLSWQQKGKNRLRSCVSTSVSMFVFDMHLTWEVTWCFTVFQWLTSKICSVVCQKCVVFSSVVYFVTSLVYSSLLCLLKSISPYTHTKHNASWLDEKRFGCWHWLQAIGLSLSLCSV